MDILCFKTDERNKSGSGDGGVAQKNSDLSTARYSSYDGSNSKKNVETLENPAHILFKIYGKPQNPGLRNKHWRMRRWHAHSMGLVLRVSEYH